MRHFSTSPKVSASRPDEVNIFFQFTYSFWPHSALRFTKPLTEMSTRSRKIIFLISIVLPMLKADNLTATYETTD
jgi:hypothetical protein